MPSDEILKLKERLAARIAAQNELDERATFDGVKGTPKKDGDAPEKKGDDAPPPITFTGEELAPLLQAGFNVFFTRHVPPLTKVTEKEAQECGRGVAPLLTKLMPRLAEHSAEVLAVGALLKVAAPRFAEAQMYARQRKEFEKENESDAPDETVTTETVEREEPFTFGPDETGRDVRVQ